MEKELELLLKDLKPTTAKTYENSYIRLRNVLDLGQKKQISKMKLDGILKRLNDIENPSSRANMLVVLRKLFTDDASQEKINLQYKQVNQEKRELQIKKNGELKKELPTHDELIQKLKQIDDPVKYIVNFLMIYVNTRNQDVMLIDVCKEPKAKYDDNRNYLVINNGKVLYIRNKYKTSKKYGMKRNTINSKMFLSKVREFLGDAEQKPLFTQRNGKPITPSSYTSYLKKVVIDGLTEAEIMKINMKHIDDKGDYNMLRKASNNRGTAISTLLQDYDMTNVSEPSNEISVEDQPEASATQEAM